MLLIGKANSNGVLGACRIISVILTNESGAGLGLSLHSQYNADNQTPIRLVAADDTSAQIFLDGVPFPNGFRIVPDAGTTFYMVVYDILEK
jgi:hypothetical protein